MFKYTFLLNIVISSNNNCSNKPIRTLEWNLCALLTYWHHILLTRNWSETDCYKVPFWYRYQFVQLNYLPPRYLPGTLIAKLSSVCFALLSCDVNILEACYDYYFLPCRWLYTLALPVRIKCLYRASVAFHFETRSPCHTTAASSASRNRRHLWIQLNCIIQLIITAVHNYRTNKFICLNVYYQKLLSSFGRFYSKIIRPSASQTHVPRIPLSSELQTA